MKESSIYTIALVVLLTLSAYLLADTVDAMVGRSLDAAPKFTGPIGQERAPIEPRKELADYAPILDRGLFGDGRIPSAGASGTAQSSYPLIGTVEGEPFAGAVLQEPANGQMFYRMHQKLPDGSVIIKVGREQVTLKRPDGSTLNERRPWKEMSEMTDGEIEARWNCLRSTGTATSGA